MQAAAAPAGEQADSDDTGFQDCIATLEVKARAAGISDQVVNDVLGRVERRKRVVELDRRQPEFTRTFADYLHQRVTAERVAQGRALLARHRSLLNDVQQRYGIPAHYLVAFWGMESDFGAHFGNIPVPDSLATLACDPRRSEFFADELMTALRIVDAGDIIPERMLGSWAGAMGQLQFLPSVFARYAVDGDGDGKRDIWGSLPDAFASAGHFLAESGWEPGVRWGREAKLPASFDFVEAGREKKRPLADWVARGITDARDRELPGLALPAAVLVPAGHNGPAFLTYDNFDVIMRWNRSEYYALAVGHFADRIAGGSPLEREPSDDAVRVTVDQVRRLQADLGTLGYDAGEPDGIPGPATRRAVSLFQQDRSLIADGYVDAALVAAVRDAASVPPEGS